LINPISYIHTLRYLRPIQIYGRIWVRFHRPKPDLRPAPPLRKWDRVPADWAVRAPSMLGPDRFSFLNEEGGLTEGWNPTLHSRLWIYNLHYFDDLNAQEAWHRKEWHRGLIHRWIRENPPGKGAGWEPYPISLRVVNWIKWILKGNKPSQQMVQSLAVQVRYLQKRLEVHLLGNHLLANAKALIFAGRFFEGVEAEAWAKRGVRIFKRELPEQILADGGHFELSPMYHSIILEDLLDLVNLFGSYPETSFHGLPANEAARRMLFWLKLVCHPDGQIALFNDAAFGIAPHPASLYAYAERLGVYAPKHPLTATPSSEAAGLASLSFGPANLVHLKTSGYIRVDNGPMTAILDVAHIGSEYLSAHAHADTLSFELSLNGQRIIVDSGTSRYDEGVERLRQRGTAAHNTVFVDGKDSSEVWSSFRVANRAKAFGLEIKEVPAGSAMVRCAHDGYRRLPGKPVHWRQWDFGENSLIVRDVIEGLFTVALGHFHFHPDVYIESRNNNLFSVVLPNNKMILCHVQKGICRLTDSTYHPEFGMNCQNRCLEVQLDDDESLILFNWS